MGNLVRHILIILSFLLLSSPVIGQSERPETIVIPVSSLGEVSETRRVILQNSLEEHLKEYFMLVPQDKLEEVREQVFEELEYDECNEDQCIMMIQEMLQVENVFHLQVIVEDKDSQLSLSWRTLYEKIKVTDVCFGCGTFQLNDKIKGLVKKIMVGKGNTLELSTEINKGKNKGVLFKIMKNDNWVWSKSGDKTINLVYEGDIRNNLPSGKGILSYKEKKIYEGDWVDGIRNGMGISFYDTGGKYFGEIKNGLLHGIGTFYYSDNTKVTGNFVEVDPNTLFLSSPEYIEFFLESQEFEFKVYDEKDNLMK